MPNIFISHSSKNNAQAVAIKQWLAENGWNDVFLDIDSEKGLHPGALWKNALSAAADRCQAVLCVISRDWVASHECKVEFRHAEYLGKRVFTAFIEQCEDKDLTSSWQRCLLFGEGKHESIDIQVNGNPEKVSFLAEGLAQLKNGLKDAGLGADYFQYDIDRSPYPGFRPLEFEDASVFFGRDVAINRALDVLRSLRERNIERMLVILGASGAGKSSFMRAGLLPRLTRDDRYFVTLPVIRPERAAVSGKNGLIASIEKAFIELKQARNRGDIRKKLEQASGFSDLLLDLQTFAGSRFTDDTGSPPVIVIPIDQGEELFSADGQDEANQFLDLMSGVLTQETKVGADSKERLNWPFAIITIRSDSYERLQKEPKLSSVKPCLFSLPPIVREEYKEIIEGPAARRTAAGRNLTIDPKLTELLLRDTEGADALPLLAFTLERLLLEYGGDGKLSLTDYEELGGVSGSIEAAIETAFADPGNEPAIPANEQEREILLRSAFIPWLAYVDPDTEERKRRVARWDEIPLETRPLLDRLIQQRLLVRDYRKVAGSSLETIVVEVAHEALLRRWPSLSAWLDQDAGAIMTIFAAKRSAGEWSKSTRRVAWLVHTGDRLQAVETLLERSEFDRLLEDEGRAYIRACCQRDDEIKAEEAAREKEAQELEQQKIEAEQLVKLERLKLAETEARQAVERAESARRLIKRTAGGAVVAVLFGIGAVLFAIKAYKQQTAAEHALGASNVMEATRRYEDGQKGQALAYLARAVRLDPSDTAWRATLTSILLRNGWCPRRAELNGREPTTAASFSPDGTKVVTIAGDEALLWDTAEGKRIGTPLRHRNTVNSANYSPDGTLVVTASTDRSVRIWDSHTGTKKLDLVRHQKPVKSASFTSDGKRIVTRTAEEMRVFNAMTGEEIGQPLAVEYSEEKYLLFRAKNKSIRVWSAEQGSQIGPDISGVSRVYTRLFSADGHRVAIQSADGIRIINVDTGKDTPLSIDPGPLKPEAFGGNGSTLLVSGRKFDAAILDIDTTGKLGQTFSYDMSRDGSYEYSLSSDNARLSVLVKTNDSNDNQVSNAQLLDTSTWKPTGAPIKHVTLGLPKYCSDGTRLITVSGKEAYVQDPISGDLLGNPLKHMDVIKSVEFSRDCRLLATIAGSEAHLLDARTGNPIGQSLTHPAQILSASFSPDGTLLMTVSSRGAHLWETKAGTDTGEIVRYGKDADIVKFSPEGNRVVTASGSKMRLWDMQTGASIGEEMTADGNIYSLKFNRDGSRILSVTWESIVLVRIWDSKKGTALGKSIPMPENYIGYNEDAFLTEHSPIISPDGRLLVGWDQDARIAKIWDVNTGRRVAKPLRLNGPTTSATFSGDSRYLVTTSDSMATVWSISSGEPLGRSTHHEGESITKVVLSSDGISLVTLTAGKVLIRYDYDEKAKKSVPVFEEKPRTVRVWKTENGQPLNEPISFQKEVYLVAISPDGHRLVTLSGEELQFWDTFSNAKIGEPIKNLKQPLKSVEFSPDGTRILTLSGREVIFWDAERTTRIGEPLSTPEILKDAYFLPDGQRLITISGNDEGEETTSSGGARIWDVPTGTADDAPLMASIAEAISGYSVSEFGSLNPVPDASARLALIRKSLGTKIREESSPHALVRWLLSDPWERTVAPLAHQTVAQYVKKTVDATRADKSHEGAESDPANNQSQDSFVADAKKEFAAIVRLYPGYPGLVSSEQHRTKPPDQKTDTDERQE